MFFVQYLKRKRKGLAKKKKRGRAPAALVHTKNTYVKISYHIIKYKHEALNVFFISTNRGSLFFIPRGLAYADMEKKRQKTNDPLFAGMKNIFKPK